MGRTGAGANTGKSTLLGAGKISIGAVSIGATRGGGSFNTGTVLRDVEFDGSQGATKGLVRKDKGNPVLTATILEVTKANLVKFMPGYQIVGDTIVSNGQIKDTDYHDTVTWTGFRAENDTDVFTIELQNVLVKDPVVLTMSDNDEMTLQVNLVAHYDLADTETTDGYLPEPFVITTKFTITKMAKTIPPTTYES